MNRIDIKPLSVNKAWKGQRFKTDAYKAYQTAMLYLLPKLNLPEAPYRLEVVFGFSSKVADIDNPCKMLIDCMQKRYGFNDKLITELFVRKEIVKKGEEFIKFQILSAAL